MGDRRPGPRVGETLADLLDRRRGELRRNGHRRCHAGHYLTPGPCPSSRNSSPSSAHPVTRCPSAAGAVKPRHSAPCHARTARTGLLDQSVTLPSCTSTIPSRTASLDSIIVSSVAFPTPALRHPPPGRLSASFPACPGRALEISDRSRQTPCPLRPGLRRPSIFV